MSRDAIAGGLRGKRKLSRGFIFALPHEIVEAFACLPRIFRKIDLDRLLGNRISRSMKWKYMQKLEELGLIEHTSKKRYRKSYDNFSEWIEKDLIPRVKSAELSASLRLRA
ncbi:MAG: hypothetical protein QW390_03125 [Candidatus Bathyarchaeia archaeon]